MPKNNRAEKSQYSLKKAIEPSTVHDCMVKSVPTIKKRIIALPLLCPWNDMR